MEHFPTCPSLGQNKLKSQIKTIEKKRTSLIDLYASITEAVNELINGVEYEDDFYKEILDKIVVNDKGHIDVYLSFFPHKWSYTVVKASKKVAAPERNISGASLPISVNTPITSR